MASALTWKAWQEKKGAAAAELKIISAGLHTVNGIPASPLAVEVMRELGIDISRHQSSILSDLLIREASIILTMTVIQRDYLREKFPDQRPHTFTLGEFAEFGNGEILDPYGQDIAIYRKTRDQLSILAKMLVHKINGI